MVHSGPEVYVALPRGTGRSSKAAGSSPPPTPRCEDKGLGSGSAGPPLRPHAQSEGRHAEPIRGRFLSGASVEAELVATWEVRLCSPPRKEDGCSLLA